VASYRHDRLQADKSTDTVRLELALLSYLFTVAIMEWRLGLMYNPVANIRILCQALSLQVLADLVVSLLGPAIVTGMLPVRRRERCHP